MPAKSATGKRLVIVESPAKAKTINKFLGPGYTVMASVGHIRDLPQGASQVPAKYKGTAWAKTGVDIENGFAPLYVVSPDKKSTISELKHALAGADELLLATDEDREGEAIAWHLMEVLKPKVPVQRMVFHEITEEAIAASLSNTRDLDADLVDAQETRRIVDRLYGYEVSPVLWRKIKQGLSAGRVQSVAVRLVVERERERMAFTAADYCDVRGTFEPGTFPARLITWDGRRVATGRDFDDQGRLTGDAVVVTTEQADQLAGDLAEAQFRVDEVKERPGTRRPAPPFITSSLQQEAGKRLRWTAQRTMRVAQGLYERGYITYMRTDSTQLSQQAIAAARSQAAELYGADHVAPQVRTYAKKSANAQEAHEAIRPAGEVFRTPGQVAAELKGDDFVLYDLIWKRTVASQMADAKISTTTITFSAPDAQGRPAAFSASGTVTLFAGFRAAYAETEEESRNPEDALTNAKLPRLSVGDTVTAAELSAESHRTQPPARYTEASLVKALEDLGIGRPSTYASIISTIQSRDYVWKKGSALVPSLLGMAVTQLMETHFGPLVNYDFTRGVEEVLDAIARGDEERVAALTKFWRGDAELDFVGLLPLVDKLGDIDAREISSIHLRDTDIVARVGRYGPYLFRPSDEKRANLRPDIPPDELTPELVAELIEKGTEEVALGAHPETGLPVVARNGRFGPYVEESLPEDAPKKAKPRRASLLKSMTLETLTLDDAVKLLSLPRVVGVDPETDEEITAQNGRYGPYLKRGTDSRSLETEEQIFTITLEQAQEIYRQPKTRGRRQAAPGKKIGEDPATGRPVELKEGRFGWYVTDGETNASLRTADNEETIGIERAAELLAERRAKGPAKKAAKKSTAKKTTAKKTTAKKTTAKKTTAKKTTAKKTSAKKSAAKKSSAKKATPAPEIDESPLPASS